MAERVVALTLTEPPVEATHWTAATMAEAVGVSANSVQRAWRACSRIGCAIVLSLDEKSRIQVLGRSQPGLLLKKGRAGTRTQDYKRHGIWG